MTVQVIEFEEARIIERTSSVTLERSVAVFTLETMAGAAESPEILIYIASEPAALNAVDYPSLAAVWDNEDDAIFDTM